MNAPKPVLPTTDHVEEAILFKDETRILTRKAAASYVACAVTRFISLYTAKHDHAPTAGVIFDFVLDFAFAYDGKSAMAGTPEFENAIKGAGKL